MNLLTIKELEDKFKVSKATILNWIKQGQIPIYQGEGQRKVPLEMIENFNKDRLKGRRNKQNKGDTVIPSNYLQDVTSTRLIKKIISIKSIYNTDNIDIKVIYIFILKLLENKGLLSNPIEYLRKTKELPPPVANLFSIDICKIQFTSEDEKLIEQILSLEIVTNHEDVLGLLYISLRSDSSKNKAGSFYTPSKVVDDIVRSTLSPFKEMPKILDPACGSGNFLISCYRFLIKKFGLKNEKKILESLWGFDIDPVAITICRINLLLLSGKYYNNIKPHNLLEEYPTTRDFDVIIGNPPWGYKFTDKEKKKLADCYPTKESYGLFTLKGMELLRDKGVLSYCLPYSLLNVKAHSPLRGDLLNKYKVLSITDLGTPFDGVFTGSINLILEKSDEKDYDFVIKNKMNQYQMSKKQTLSMPLYNINISSSKKSYDAVQKINDHGDIYLKNNCKFALGLVTGNNKKHILATGDKDSEPIIKGNDIFKFRVRRQLDQINFQPRLYQQVAPLHLYRAKEKIVYRFINRTLTFGYDDNQYLTLNSANIIIPSFECIDFKYILAILNSSIMQFYHQNTFSSLKILRHQIENLPIPKPSRRVQENIVEMVEYYLASDNIDDLLPIYKEIDKEVFKIYNLTAKEIDVIEKEVKINNLH